jgi:hypothetical protein
MPFGKPTIPTAFTLTVVTRMPASDFGPDTVANLGWTEAELPVATKNLIGCWRRSGDGLP